MVYEEMWICNSVDGILLKLPVKEAPAFYGI